MVAIRPKKPTPQKQVNHNIYENMEPNNRIIRYTIKHTALETIMRKQTIITFLILVLAIIAGCAQRSEQSISYDTVGSAAPEAALLYAEEAPADFEVADGLAANGADAPELVIGRESLAQQQQRLIIKTGNMSLDVDDIDASVGEATDFVVGLGGYIVSQDVSGFDQYRSATLTLGVPVDSFEAAMANFRSYGRVDSESASGQDVTEEFVDLSSRLENLQATQGRLRQLFEDAQNVEETLEVDRELRQIEGEINIVQGRMKYLTERAAFSTITLRMSATSDEPIGQPEKWSIGATFGDATDDLVEGVQELTEGVVYFAVAILPFLLILALVAWIVWRIVRRVWRRNRPITPAQPAVVNSAESSD